MSSSPVHASRPHLIRAVSVAALGLAFLAACSPSPVVQSAPSTPSHAAAANTASHPTSPGEDPSMSEEMPTLEEVGKTYDSAATSITQEIIDTLTITPIGDPAPTGGGGSCANTTSHAPDSSTFVGTVGSRGHLLPHLSEHEWIRATEIVAAHAAELGYTHTAQFTDGEGNPHLVFSDERSEGSISWTQSVNAVLTISSPCVVMRLGD